MDLGVAIALASAGLQESGARGAREFERVQSALTADQQGFDRQFEIVDRRGRRGEVVDAVERILPRESLGNIRFEEVESLLLLQFRQIPQVAGYEVVHAHNFAASVQELLTEVGAEEAGGSGDETAVAQH